MRIEVLQPHTHAGVPYAPGAILNIDHDLARWLIERGVARPAETTHKSKGD